MIINNNYVLFTQARKQKGKFQIKKKKVELNSVHTIFNFRTKKSQAGKRIKLKRSFCLFFWFCFLFWFLLMTEKTEHKVEPLSYSPLNSNFFFLFDECFFSYKPI